MVNFQSDVSVSTPAGNLVKVLVLEARYNTLLSLEDYNKKSSSNVRVSQSDIKARLGTWFLEHLAYLERTQTKQEDKQEQERIKALLFFNNKDLEKEEILKIFCYLNAIMDKLRITKLDTRIQYDTTDIEADNKANMYA